MSETTTRRPPQRATVTCSAMRSPVLVTATVLAGAALTVLTAGPTVAHGSGGDAVDAVGIPA